MACGTTFDVEALVVRLSAGIAGVGVVAEGRRFVPPEAPGVFEVGTEAKTPAFRFGDVAEDGRRRAERLLEALPDVAKGDLGKGKCRPVVFSVPEPELLEPLAALTLRLGAAWVLEPAADAFVATARWVRPTLLVATPQALEALAAAWDGGDRRWSRLRAVVLWPDASGDVESVAESDSSPWSDAFGVPAVAWPRP